MVCKANQLSGCYMKVVCAERCFRVGYINCKIIFTSLGIVLNCVILKNLSRLLLPGTKVMNCA